MLIYLHKEQMLDAVARHLPARHYVMVDDKLRLLDAMKKVWGSRLTTIFVRHGHYALDLANISAYPAADIFGNGAGAASGPRSNGEGGGQGAAEVETLSIWSASSMPAARAA